MKKLIPLFIVCLLSISAPAVVIQQVLTTPLGTDSGGEAIELLNDEPQAVDISGWWISTEASEKDSVIPVGTILALGQRYLVTDVNWSVLKDEVRWREADHEEVITLGNTDAGIALRNASGDPVDAVGWGDSTKILAGLFRGTPLSRSQKGHAFVRMNNTGNNTRDFVIIPSSFLPLNKIMIVASIQETGAPVLLLDDDDPREGVQWKPTPGKVRKITVHVQSLLDGSSFVEFRDTRFAVSNGTSTIDLDYHTPPGTYNITLVSQKKRHTTSVEVLRTTAIEAEQSVLLLEQDRPSTLKLHNRGNIPVRLFVQSGELRQQSTVLPPVAILFSQDADHFFPLNNGATNFPIEILPMDTAAVTFKLDPRHVRTAGTYTGILTFIPEHVE